MELFKERLRKTASDILFAVALLAIMLVFWWLISLSGKIGAWILIIIVVAFILLVVCNFIYWLFIEPFRKKGK